MGMFDTFHFEKPVVCAVCRSSVSSTQTKAFDRALEDFRIGDCAGHAEEIRIVREELYCDACRNLTGQFVYLVVYRGILADIASDLPTAEARLRDFSMERLLLWYHDLYAKLVAERRRRQDTEHFLVDVANWYEGGYDRMSPEERKGRWPQFFFRRSLLESATDPVSALRAYLDEREAEEEEE